MIKRLRKSLTLKWMVLSVLLATIPLAIAGFNIIQIYQKNLKKSVIEIEETKASIVVETTQAFLEKVTSNLIFLAKHENLRGVSPFHTKEYLKHFLYQNDYLSELTLLNEKGREIIKVSKYKVVGPSNLKDQSKSEMFRVASKSQVYYGDVRVTVGEKPSMMVAIPIEKHKGKTIGVLTAQIPLQHLWDTVSKIKIGEKGFACIVDREGNLISHPETIRVWMKENVSYLCGTRCHIQKESVFEWGWPSGERFLNIYKRIKGVDWIVIVQVPVEEAYEPVRQISKTALKWILIALVVAVILSIFLTRRLIHPIKQLSGEMTKVSEGNLDVHIETTAKDEVGLLTESFNQMIQDLKQSRDAIVKSEEKYKKIFEGSRDVVFITTLDGKFLDVNQSGVELFGYNTKEELLKIDTVAKLYLYPEERKKYQAEITQKGFTKDFEARLKRKDGTPLDALITASVRKDEEGQIIGYEGIIKDISIRKRMEEELVQRKEELQALYDLSVLVNQSLDVEKVLLVALDKALSITGFEMGTLHLLHEDGENLDLRFYREFSPMFIENVKVLKYGEGVAGKAVQLKQSVIVSIDEYPSPRILPFLREEGVRLTVGIPLLAKEKAIGAITLSSRSIRNLNQREINLLESIGNQIGMALENARLFSAVAKAKSEWETTFDAVTDLITIRYKDYRIIRANKVAFKRYGLKPEQMIGKKCFEILHQSDQPCEGCYVTKTLMTKKPASGERDSKYLNGIFQYYTFPVYDEDGEVVAVVDLAREITEEKRLEIEKEVINNINKILASSIDVRGLIKAVHSELKKVFDSERMTITLLSEQGKGFQYFALEKDYEAKELVGGVVYPKERTPFERATDTGQPIIVPDTRRSDSWVDQKLLKEGIRSSLVFPLEYKGEVIGTMNFGSKETDHFSDDHVHFLRSIAPGLAISIQNALLFEETKKRLDELTILYEIMKVSASSLNLDKLLKEIIGSLNNFFKFEAFGIALIDENTKRLVIHPSFMGHPIKDIEKLGLCLGKGITGWVAEKGESLLVNDVRKDSRYIVYDESIGSEICVPLKVGQKVIGVIDAQSKALNAFSDDDLRLLSIIGGQVATLIENIRLYEGMKQSEEKYRTVVEGAHDGICVIGKDNRFKYVNRRLVEIQGYAEEELIGMDFRDLLDEGSKQFMGDRFILWGKGEKLSPRFELNVFRKDGEVRNVEINARVMKDSKGDAQYVVFTKDITERKKMEEQLLQGEKLRALAEMASGVAHDFNNALAAILGNTQLLLYTVQDEEIKETLKTIEKVTKDSAQTVRRLQDFTRKRVHQELFKVDVNAIIRDCIEITKPKWKDESQSRGVRIEIVPTLEDIPPVSGNASELREVFTNMIFNAIEAMPGGGKIDVRTFRKRKEVVTQISDTGMGITEEVKKKIFEPFFTTKPFTNAGLGLSMSYGIIKRFGGEIEVESRVGHGTTFTIILPIGGEGREEGVSPQTIKKGRKAHILVIDDEEFIRSVLSRILAQGNHQVTLAEDGEKGIQLFKGGKFDMVLTDLGMPGISGWEVCRIIKKMNPRTPVGMITGWKMELNRNKMEEYGLDFIIAKPFDFNQILNVVAETMESKEERLRFLKKSKISDYTD